MSEKVIFGQPVENGTSSFKIMIDTSTVSDYVTKAEIEKKELNIYGDAPEIGSNEMYMESTPTMNTPNILAGGSSAIHTLGGMTPRSPGWASPSFATPAHHGGRDMMFTPIYGKSPSYGGYENSVRSPSRTPLPLPNQTPF